MRASGSRTRKVSHLGQIPGTQEVSLVFGFMWKIHPKRIKERARNRQPPFLLGPPSKKGNRFFVCFLFYFLGGNNHPHLFFVENSHFSWLKIPPPKQKTAFLLGTPPSPPPPPKRSNCPLMYFLFIFCWGWAGKSTQKGKPRSRVFRFPRPADFSSSSRPRAFCRKLSSASTAATAWRLARGKLCHLVAGVVGGGRVVGWGAVEGGEGWGGGGGGEGLLFF